MVDPELLRSEIENVRQSIAALDKRVAELRESDRQALSVAVRTLREHLDLLNDLKQIIIDQSQDFARYPEVVERFASVKKDVSTLEGVVESLRTQVDSRGAASAIESRVLLVGGVALALAAAVGVAAIVFLR